MIRKNSIGGGNYNNTASPLSTSASKKNGLALCFSAIAAVVFCALSTACSPDDGSIVQDAPFTSPTDSTTQSGGGGFIFDDDDEPAITIPLDGMEKNIIFKIS